MSNSFISCRSRWQLAKQKNTNEPPQIDADDGFYPTGFWAFITANTVVVPFGNKIDIETYTFWTRPVEAIMSIEVAEVELNKSDVFEQIVVSKATPNADVPPGWELCGKTWKRLPYTADHWVRCLRKIT